MKRTLLAGAAMLLLLGGALAACGAQPAGETGEQQGTSPEEWPDLTDMGGRDLIIAEGNDTPPFCYIDTATGKPTGFDYEFFPELCKRANCNPVFKEFSWDGIFEAGAAGEWDISLWGISLTLERSKLVDYADPVAEYYQVLAVRSDSEFTDVNSFVASDAILGAVPGGTEYITSVKLVGEERVHSYDSFDLPVLAVINGDIDGMVYDNFPMAAMMQEHPGKLKLLGAVTSPALIAPPMRPGSPYETAVNAAINKMWADGTMQALQDKWFPPPLTTD